LFLSAVWVLTTDYRQETHIAKRHKYKWNYRAIEKTETYIAEGTTLIAEDGTHRPAGGGGVIPGTDQHVGSTSFGSSKIDQANSISVATAMVMGKSNSSAGQAKNM
jgi:hypothetical protein